MICAGTPVIDLNNSADKYPPVPTAEVPMLNLSPSFLAISTTSPIVLPGKLGCASSATGIEATNPIGAKSLRGSKLALA